MRIGIKNMKQNKKAVVNITKFKRNNQFVRLTVYINKKSNAIAIKIAFVWAPSKKKMDVCVQTCVQRRHELVKGKQNNKVIRLIVVLKKVHACLQYSMLIIALLCGWLIILWIKSFSFVHWLSMLPDLEKFILFFYKNKKHLEIRSAGIAD